MCNSDALVRELMVCLRDRSTSAGVNSQYVLLKVGRHPKKSPTTHKKNRVLQQNACSVIDLATASRRLGTFKGQTTIERQRGAFH